MVIGIFGLLVLGCFFLLYSSEKKRLNQKKHVEKINVIEQTNGQLDNILNIDKYWKLVDKESSLMAFFSELMVVEDQ